MKSLMSGCINLVFLSLCVSPLQAQIFDVPSYPKPVKILFDFGNPNASVAIAGNEILELDSLYEQYQVIGFEENAVIVRDVVSADLLKWFEEGKVNPKDFIKAKQLFIVKQMRAIYEAQVQFLHKYEQGYCASVQQLIQEEFLPNGFKANKKQNYEFEIKEVGQTRRLAPQYEKEPIFLAIAKPINRKKDPYFFSVDHLGQVRYAKDIDMVSWAPIWEYLNPLETTTSRPLKYEEDESQ